MVFESLIVDLLNKYLGDYVENLDRKQLKVGIWGGDVVLQNLRLKENALDELDLPVKTVYGHLGKLQLKIPWKNLYNSPVEATVEKLFLLVVPNQEVKYDAEKEKKWNRDVKMAQLKKIELLKKAQQEKDALPTDKGFTEKLATQIVKNIQIFIRDIHIRYEDRITRPEKPFSIGITLNSLEVSSIDSWGATVPISLSNLIFKQLSIKCLAIYWNSRSELLSLEKEDREFRFQDGIATKEKSPDFKYMVGPINAVSNLRINPRPELDGTNFQVPKMKLLLDMESLEINVSKNQYQDLVFLLESIDIMTRAIIYRKYRPGVPCKGNPKCWWHFAVTCILEEHIRRRRNNFKMEVIQAHRQKCRDYYQAYFSKVAGRASADGSSLLTELEDQLDVFNIVLIREKVENECERRGIDLKQPKEQKGWFSGWWGGGASKVEEGKDEIVKKFADAMNTDEKQKLYRAIGYQEGATIAVFPETFVQLDIKLNLHTLQIRVRNEEIETPEVLDVVFSEVGIRIKTRPSAKAFAIQTKLKGLSVSGMKQDGWTPMLVQTEYTEDEDNTEVSTDSAVHKSPKKKKGHYLFEAFFEAHPMDKTCDQRLHIKSSSLSIIYDALTINSIVDAFTTDNQQAIQQIQAAANVKLAEIKQKSAMGFQHLIDQHSILDLQVDLKASHFILPKGGIYNGRCCLLLMSSGNIKFFSVPQKTKYKHSSKGGEELLKEVMAMSYDHFQAQVTDLEVLFYGDDDVITQDKSKVTILVPVTIIVNVSRCITDDPRLPKMKIEGQLPELLFRLSERQVLGLMQLAASIPFPEHKEEPEEWEKKDLFASQSSIASFTHTLNIRAAVEKQKIDRLSVEDIQQLINFELNFELTKFSLKILKEIDEQIMDFIELKLEFFDIAVVQQTYTVTAVTRLGGIFLKQYYKKQQIFLASTPTDTGDVEYLLNIAYSFVDRKSPEFYSRYKSTVQQVEIDFTELKCCLHLEAVLDLLQWTSSLQTSISQIEHKAKPYQKSISLSRDTLFRAPAQKRLTKRSKVDVIDFKLAVAIGEISLKLCYELRDVCLIGVSGGHTGIILKKSYTEVATKLNGIYIKDLYKEKTYYTKILSIIDKKEMVAAKVIIFNDEAKTHSRYDMAVKANLGRFRFVFLNRFIADVVGFFGHFQTAQEKVIQASQAAAEAARANVTDAYNNALRIKIEIDIKAPLIVIPANSKSFEALLFNLGNLTIKNNLSELVTDKAPEPAVLDRIQLELVNVKLSRIVVNELSELESERGIITPISFKLIVQRNLSNGWFNEVPDLEIAGRLHTIHIKITGADYGLVLRILGENLGEASTKNKVKPRQPHTPDAKVLASKAKSTLSTIVSKDEISMNMKFTLTLDSLVLELFKEEGAESDSLAKFTLYVISMKGSMLSDGSLHTSLLLLDFMMDDTRPSRMNKITRYMERKKGKGADDGKNMIDITYQQKESVMFIDLRVCSFDLILNMDHILRIGEFFLFQEAQTGATLPAASASTTRNMKVTKSTPEPTREATAALIERTVNLKVEHPDIILVESLDDINTNALLLHTELMFRLKVVGDHQSIMGSINDLQLFTSCYNPSRRKKTKTPILRPVSLHLTASTPDSEGLHVDLTSTDVRISVSPGSIQLLSSVYSAVTAFMKPSEGDEKAEADHSDMWDVVPFQETEFPFLSPELAMEASQFTPKETKPKKILSEICVVSAPAVIITIETGFGRSTIPMLLLEASISALARDWSSQLSVEGKVTLQMGYFNNTLALWEPLLEPVEKINVGEVEFEPWELTIVVESSKSDMSDTDSLISNQSDGSGGGKNSMDISISSQETANMTVTKTCLELLRKLGESFSDAIYKPMESGSEIEEAQYVLKNETGLKVTVSMKDSDFKVVLPESKKLEDSENARVDEVVLGDNTCLRLVTKVERVISLQTPLSPQFITAQIEGFSNTLELPVLRSDKRFFLLTHQGSESWGVVSEVGISEGTTHITLRSIVQIKNFFSVPINVYYMTKKGNELALIGKVKPHGTLNIPLSAVYTPSSEIFFSAEGYSVSVIPFVWKDLQKNFSKSIIMQCNPKHKEDKEPFFIRAVGEIEQVFFELSNRHTMSSTCYNIYIRPTVILKNLLPVNIICCVQGIPVDKPVEKGKSLEIPTAEPGCSSIVIRIPDYLDKEWSCRREIEASPEPLDSWAFESYESTSKNCLELGMHSTDVGGSISMTLFCPFWMINKTGLMLSYRSGEDGPSVLYHPPTFEGPVMFSYRAKGFYGKKKSSVRVGNGTWSEKFSLDVAGSSGVVSSRSDHVTYELGVLIKLTYSTLTKQVIFTPYHVIINHFPVVTQYQEVLEKGSHSLTAWIDVEPGNCAPYWPSVRASSIRLRIKDTKETTIAFPFDTSHHTLLRLANKYGAINVDVQVNEGSIYISLYPYEPGMAPSLIVNHCDSELQFIEKLSTDNKFVVPPHHKKLFAWSAKPCQDNVLVFPDGKTEHSLNKDGVGELKTKNSTIYWVSFLHDIQRVVLFTNDFQIAEEAQTIGDTDVARQEIEFSLHSLGVSLVDNNVGREIVYIGITSSDIIWETRKEGKKRYKPLSKGTIDRIEVAYNLYKRGAASGEIPIPIVPIDGKMTVDFEAMEVVKPSVKQLRRSYSTGAWLSISTTSNQYMLHAKINKIQIDNQLFDCVFPVVLSPVPPPKSVIMESSPKPFIEVSIVKRLNQHSSVQQYKYFKILIQEFHIKVDMGFINALVNLFEAGKETQVEETAFQKDLDQVAERLFSFVTLASYQEKKNFYDMLHFSPLKIHVSFSMSSQTSSGGPAAIPPIIVVFMQSFGVTLTDIQDVLLKLSYFEREHTFLTQRQLLAEVQTHYIGQLIKQIYVLVFGLDVIGNPYGLVLGISKGAADLFYEPFQGAIQGPGEFAEGLVLGVRSLLGHTVGGAAGAMSRITGVMGKSLAALTFDKDYQRKRREVMNKRPANMQEGLAQSSKGLVMGVVEGIGGVITKPIHGAKDEGVQGFFKGVGKGFVGLVTRPTAGIVDFASGSLNAVKRATDLSEEASRLRTPRHFKNDGLVRPYSKKSAEGHKLLMEMEKGKYAKTDNYLYHIPIGLARVKDVLLLTDQRLVYLSHNELFGGHQLEWEHTWGELAGVPKEIPRGIQFNVRDKKKGVLSIFTHADSGKVLLIEDATMRKHVLNIMVQQISKLPRSPALTRTSTANEKA